MTARLRALSPADVDRIGADPAYLHKLNGGPELPLPHTWHALHFLLCNDPWDGPEPLNHAILGGAAVLEDDLGPRVLNAELVARIAAALFPMNIPAVVADFDAAGFERRDIYPGGWAQTADWPARLAADLAALRQFYQACAAAGDAVLIRLGTNA